MGEAINLFLTYQHPLSLIKLYPPIQEFPGPTSGTSSLQLHEYRTPISYFGEEKKDNKTPAHNFICPVGWQAILYLITRQADDIQNTMSDLCMLY